MTKIETGVMILLLILFISLLFLFYIKKNVNNLKDLSKELWEI